MSEQMKPCPACGGEGVINIVGHGVNLYQVRCKKCSQCGPIEATANNAETRWNALPRALVWTTEPPKVQGWYWLRSVCPISSIASPAIPYFFNVSQREVIEGNCCQWAGPIPEPQEPRP